MCLYIYTYTDIHRAHKEISSAGPRQASVHAHGIDLTSGIGSSLETAA